MQQRKFLGSRSDRLYRDDAERQRAYRQRMSKTREVLTGRAQLVNELAFVLRELGLRDRGRYGWTLPLTDAQIVQELINDYRAKSEALAQRATEREAAAAAGNAGKSA